MIIFKQKPNAVLVDVCAEAALLVKLNGDTVRFTYGEITVVANPGDSAWTVERAYWSASKKSKTRNPHAD